MRICFTTILGIILFFTSCIKEKPSPEITAYGTVNIEFDQVVGITNLYLHTTTYTNSWGENFKIQTLNYYVSNFKFYKADGSEYVVPQDSSYFLIRENRPETRIAHFQIPEGEYSKMSFVLGIDSVRCTLPADRRTGVLDPVGKGEGMYWDWNSGYIFFMFEGESDRAPLDADGIHTFKYHVGGYGGYDAPTAKNIREVSLDLSMAGVARVRSGHSSNIFLTADISKIFDGVHALHIEEVHTVLGTEGGADIADNYAQMFAHDRTEN